MRDWKDLVCLFVIGFLQGIVEGLEKSKKKKCRCQVYSKVDKTLKSFSENNEITLLEGVVVQSSEL